jgi:acetylglutamate synthase
MLPLKPADFPANMVWMGQGLEPVATIKVKKGHVVGQTSILITPYEFIRLKSAVEGSDDLCTWAVDEAVKSCLNSMKEATDRATDRETNDAELIKAYETRLKLTEKSLIKLERHNKIMLYVAGGLALVASSATALLIWGK